MVKEKEKVEKTSDSTADERSAYEIGCEVVKAKKIPDYMNFDRGYDAIVVETIQKMVDIDAIKAWSEQEQARGVSQEKADSNAQEAYERDKYETSGIMSFYGRNSRFEAAKAAKKVMSAIAEGIEEKIGRGIKIVVSNETPHDCGYVHKKVIKKKIVKKS